MNSGIKTAEREYRLILNPQLWLPCVKLGTLKPPALMMVVSQGDYDFLRPKLEALPSKR